jgi:protein-S-isoprenylcysteine O-methyltransferase Ste14
MRFESGVVTDLLARAIVIVLFTFLSLSFFRDFMKTGHVTGLLLLASESLVVVLTFVRRRTRLIDRSAIGTVTTALAVAGPPLVRPVGGTNPVPDAVTAIAFATGLVLVIVGKITLGRSFGIVPANRGVVMRGPYMFVRHPIYTGYILTHVALLVAHPSVWNVTLLAIADTALVVRALIEERVLSGDAAYQSYCQRVVWHLVPGVF